MTVDHRVDTVIRGGTVVHPSGTAEAAIAITDGKIAAIASEELLPPAEQYLDAHGKYVMPGVVDSHTHIYLDSYRTISESAAFGGVTTILSYIWPDQSMDIPGSVEHWRRFGEAGSIVNFGVHVGLVDSVSSLEHIEPALKMGAISLNMMMGFKRRGLMVSDEFMMAAMERIGEAGGLATVHCESGGAVFYLEEKLRAVGATAPPDLARSRPVMTEVEGVQRAIAIASMAQCPLYIVHLSSAAALEVVAQAQLAGQPVFVEVCPHYLTLTEEELQRQGPLVKVIPPLRSPADIQGLWSGIEHGVVTTVASDHEAYTREMKQGGWVNIFDCPIGIPAVETMLPLMYEEAVVKRGMPITMLPRLLSENPARQFGLYPRKGSIEVGSDADLVIFDPHKEVTIHAGALHGRADYTPFEGMKVSGWPTDTLVRGNVVVRDGELIDSPAKGEFLTRSIGA